MGEKQSHVRDGGGCAKHNTHGDASSPDARHDLGLLGDVPVCQVLPLPTREEQEDVGYHRERSQYQQAGAHDAAAPPHAHGLPAQGWGGGGGEDKAAFSPTATPRTAAPHLTGSFQWKCHFPALQPWGVLHGAQLHVQAAGKSEDRNKKQTNKTTIPMLISHQDVSTQKLLK